MNRCVVSFLILLIGLSGKADQIAFVRGVEQQDQRVCVVDLDSGAVTEAGPGSCDGRPTWSPDGEWLAFDTRAEQGMGICIVRPDGGELRRIPHASGWNRDPRWSPDGKLLAYTSYGENGFDTRITVYDLASGTEQTWPKDPQALMMRPVWMPGMRLLYALRPGQDVQWDAGNAQGLAWLQNGGVLLAIGIRESGGKPVTDLFVVTSDNCAPLPEWVLPSPGNYIEWAAEPSCDGSSIAWESTDGGDREIFVLNKKGAFDISNDRASDWNPVWSPDGEWLAFESFRSGRRGVYRAYVGTARISPVAVTPGADNWSPTWAPDGHQLAFVSDRTGNPELFVSGSNGENVRQITNDGLRNFAPAWRPAGAEK
ncbi:MAG: hypothetical protein NTZ09_13015 [Candidatus Hydrogenedentes bacterium]|nr:hypothetical protein [Candidatus Hydrogenedentota bacterium]